MDLGMPLMAVCAACSGHGWDSDIHVF